MTVLLVAIGVLAYGVEFPGSSFLGFLVYVALGTATLCILGIALTPFTPTVDAASTIAPFTVVILAFFSGVWIPIDQLPHWLEEVGRIFPLFHLAVGLQSTLSPEPAAPASKAATSPSSSSGPWPAPGSPPAAFAGSRRRGQDNPHESVNSLCN